MPDTRVDQFLAAIEYRRAGDERPAFRTYAFLITELGGTLGSLDESERIEAYREVEIDELPGIAESLDGIARSEAPEIFGDWSDWGRFRAIVHRAVYRALETPSSYRA